MFLTQTRINSISSMSWRSETSMSKRRKSRRLCCYLFSRGPGVTRLFMTLLSAPGIINSRFCHAPRVSCQSRSSSSCWCRWWLNKGISKVDVCQFEEVVGRLALLFAATALLLLPETRVSDWPEIILRYNTRQEKNTDTQDSMPPSMERLQMLTGSI